MANNLTWSSVPQFKFIWHSSFWVPYLILNINEIIPKDCGGAMVSYLMNPILDHHQVEQLSIPGPSVLTRKRAPIHWSNWTGLIWWFWYQLGAQVYIDPCKHDKQCGPFDLRCPFGDLWVCRSILLLEISPKFHGLALVSAHADPPTWSLQWGSLWRICFLLLEFYHMISK